MQFGLKSPNIAIWLLIPRPRSRVQSSLLAALCRSLRSSLEVKSLQRGEEERPPECWVRWGDQSGSLEETSVAQSVRTTVMVITSSWSNLHSHTTSPRAHIKTNIPGLLALFPLSLSPPGIILSPSPPPAHQSVRDEFPENLKPNLLSLAWNCTGNLPGLSPHLVLCRH